MLPSARLNPTEVGPVADIQMSALARLLWVLSGRSHCSRRDCQVPLLRLNSCQQKLRVCKVAVQHFDVTLSSTQVNAMDQPRIVTTPPILCADSAAVWFSAYAFGWGYCAFALTFELVCEELGARNETCSRCGSRSN